MKTKNIIKKLKYENEQDLKFKYNYLEISNRLGFKSISSIDQFSFKQNKSMFKFYKYACMVLLVISFSLGGLLIFQSKEQPINESLGAAATSENLVYQYFEDSHLKYIKSPVKTEIINDTIVNIYMGLTSSEQIVFVFSFLDSTIESNMQIDAEKLITSDSEFTEDSTASQGFISFYNDNLNSFVTQKIDKEPTYSIKIQYSVDDSNIEKSITLDIQEFLDYLE